MEVLPHDIVEKILCRVPFKSLLRFRFVSKQWKSTIESPYFHTKRSTYDGKCPDVFLNEYESLRTLAFLNDHVDDSELEVKTLVLEASSSSSAYRNLVCGSSCDGLVCLYQSYKSSIVLNPTTRWHRFLPLSNLQHLIQRRICVCILPKLGFGKDKINGTYKLVWLYNSSEFGLENATTCEVFDFSIKSWRYVTHSSPYRVNACVHPLFLDGSLYWLTEERQTKVLSLDLHRETFQVISKTPFVDAKPEDIFICSLNNRLCTSVYNQMSPAIWSYNSENKTWCKIYSLWDWNGMGYPNLTPLAVLEKNKLLCYEAYERRSTGVLVIYDPETKYAETLDSVLIEAGSINSPVCYFKSLLSIP